MSDERLIRLPQVESLTGLKRAHIYALARRGLFPLPLKIGARASAWTLSSVSGWVADRVREAQDRCQPDNQTGDESDVVAAIAANLTPAQHAELTQKALRDEAERQCRALVAAGKLVDAGDGTYRLADAP